MMSDGFKFDPKMLKNMPDFTKAAQREQEMTREWREKAFEALPQMAEVMLDKVTMDRIYYEVLLHFSQYLKPLPLSTVSQRFSRKVRGVRVLDSLLADLRFEIMAKRSGGRVVFPRAELNAYCKAMAEAEGQGKLPGLWKANYIVNLKLEAMRDIESL